MTNRSLNRQKFIYSNTSNIKIVDDGEMIK